MRSFKVTIFALYVEIIPEKKLNSVLIIQFTMKPGKSETESFRLLTDVLEMMSNHDHVYLSGINDFIKVVRMLKTS